MTPTDTETDPINHLITATFALSNALQALRDHQGYPAPVEHIRQDSSEHLAEVELLLELIKRVLRSPQF